jgi:mono/diheme cytochrome c family protein|tara:strand:- start:1869 stop:2273 length:405 start_codon:yes stop_codon:yes gene_type:complete
MKQQKFSILILSSIFFTFSCAPKPTLEVPEPYKKGQQYFHEVCSNCHGSDAMGKHTQAPRLIDEEYLASNYSDAEISETILNGTDKMPPQRKNVTPEKITEIIKYLRYSQKTAGIESEDSEEDESEEESTPEMN